MKALLMSLTMGLGFLTAVAHAQAPAAAPAGSTGQCKDGTYYSGDSKKGACRGHKGIKEWYAGASTATAAGDAPAKTKTKSSHASKSDDATAGAPATASTVKPANATGMCKDGSYTSGDSRKGACRGHKGLKEWYGAAAGAATATPAAPSMPPTPKASAPAPTPTPMPAPAATPAPTRTAAPPAPETRAAAAGGGAGKVWLNTETRVYHCPGDRYYGKTKQGEYLSEADAIAKGAHGSHGKGCTR